MADEGLVFSVEEIPDSASVFMRAYKDRIKNGVPTPSAFVPHNGGMSVDWDRYSTPQETRARAKKPEMNAVVSMNAEDIRDIKEYLDVLHKPIPENQAHSEVNLPEDTVEQTEVRLRLSQIAILVIPASV